jgi:hypothetical protein
MEYLVTLTCYQRGTLIMELYEPVTYKNATEPQRAVICNGAGPRKYGWLVPDTLWGLRITEAANIHDWMYWEGEAEEERETADTVFLRNMLIIVFRNTTKTPILGVLLRWFRSVRAVGYFWAVREFGKSAFYDKAKMRKAIYEK